MLPKDFVFNSVYKEAKKRGGVRSLRSSARNNGASKISKR